MIDISINRVRQISYGAVIFDYQQNTCPVTSRTIFYLLPEM